ncbi:Peptide chain release factor RF3 [Buchnera aphidicola (Eriosoma grossulariae)]|uniref:peptide chain release factor 3 n=1 Tax=Buchnera aphidicola TaxID=9 RepID=UPI00346426EC
MSIKNNFIEIQKRRTFAIIAHPDSGKTTLTEKILFLGKVIHETGTIQSKKSKKYVKSDWMKIEKERGISITSSVMQFTYCNCLINLLDTPGHEDFSEDTYRILTAVDFCLMVIDSAKGVEIRTKKLMHVLSLNNTPTVTFINKLDRDSKDPIKILDEIESELKIKCIPITWPIGCGSSFKGIYNFYNSMVDVYKFKQNNNFNDYNITTLSDLYNKSLEMHIGLDFAKKLREDVELINTCYSQFNNSCFVDGKITPVFFGSALRSFGINHMFNFLVRWGPCPKFKHSNTRVIYPEENLFTGFVFKIQANMDLKHRDRIAFIRIVSGRYYKGIKLQNVRLRKTFILNNAIRFLAGDRNIIEEAYPGDIIGIYNHGSIVIGDTFTEGELINFLELPRFSPEIFRIIYLKNPLKKKQLFKGLLQLSEEGAVQIFYPLINNDLVLGVLGILQLDVILERLKLEYQIEACYKNVSIAAIRWIFCNDLIQLDQFKLQNKEYLAIDSSGYLTYIAPSLFNLNLIISNYPQIKFSEIRQN